MPKLYKPAFDIKALRAKRDEEMNRRYKQGVTKTQLSKEYRLSYMQVNRIIK